MQTKNAGAGRCRCPGLPTNLAGPGEPAERVERTVATGDYFATLGTPPLLGRVFGPADDEPGQNRVAVISHRFWQRRFAGQTDALGRSLRLDGENITIIGVMPPGFGHRLWSSSEIWKPIGWTAEDRANRGNNGLNELARLKPGVSLRQAQAEMNGLAAQLAREYPGNNRDCGVRLVTLLASATDETVRRLALVRLRIGNPGPADRLREPRQPADGPDDRPFAGTGRESRTGTKR